jgi:hypothetical protein
MQIPVSTRKPRRWWRYLPLLVLLGLVVYTPLVLWWSYSEGERVGILQKLSHKGWVCKTYEGELALYVISGVTPQIWDFTVRDPVVAARLNQMLGERVRLHYSEHRGLPTSCFGDTGYFVDSAQRVEPPAPMPASPGPGVVAAPPQTPYTTPSR